MAKSKRYNIIIRHNSDPSAPSFDEVMQNSVKPWIAKILKYNKKKRSNKKTC